MTSLINDLASIREKRNAIRKVRRSKSVMDKHKTEILTLRKLDASYGDIAYWLRTKKKITITPQAIGIRVRHWNKLDEQQAEEQAIRSS